MGKMEKIVLADPPAPRAPAVVARKMIAERELTDLKLEIPERVLAVAEGKPGARENLAVLQQKIAAVTFEIEHNRQARDLAARLDEEAIGTWKAAVQTLDPEEIVAGIAKDGCCHRCGGGFGCVITGADVLALQCAHPLIVGALVLNRYRDNPKIQAVYAAACAKLGVRKSA